MIPHNVIYIGKAAFGAYGLDSDHNPNLNYIKYTGINENGGYSWYDSSNVKELITTN